MRKKFSERQGFVKVRDAFQIDSMDDGLRNRLWNKIKIMFVDSMDDGLRNRLWNKIKIMFVDKLVDRFMGYEYSLRDDKNYKSDDGMLKKKNDKNFILKLYDQFLKDSFEPILYSKDEIKEDLKKRYFLFEWYIVYDFIEYIPEVYHNKNINVQFKKEVNQVLEEEMSAYRFVDNYIAPIIDEVEIKEVEEALDCQYAPTRKHLSNALELLSDRTNPNYQNSIKESITAVESVAKIITGKDTDLANCIKAMNIDLNKQFKTSMINLYGWTCKEDGIRHGHTKEELKTDFEEARYMLVSCSAFVNYLIAKNEKN